MARRTFDERWEAQSIKTSTTLRFISGKWFLDGKEYKDVDRYLIQADLNINSVDKLKRVKDMFITLYGEKGDWLPLPIIEEAQHWICKGKLQPLCFPLNNQQLTIINRLLIGQNEEVCFICTGIGGSGKSTFLNIVKQIFENDVAACTLSDLSGFNISEAISHRLIASDELASDELNNGMLKSMISRQCIQVNPKNQTPYQAKCQSALFFCCNEAPKIDLDDTGMLRRIIYYKMDKKIENPDRTLNHREWTHEDLVNIVAHALRIKITDWKQQFEEDTHFFLLKNNSVFRFKDKTEYSDYVKECKNANLKPFSEPKWQSIRELIDEWYNKPTQDKIDEIEYVADRLGELKEELINLPIDFFEFEKLYEQLENVEKKLYELYEKKI